MAIGERQIFPIDLNQRRALGVEIPFNGPVAFTSNYLTKDAIRNNLTNYLLTNPGERVANPNFGGGLRELLFEQIEENTFEFIKDNIQEKINQNFSNIQLENIEILGDEEYQTIEIKIFYSIPNTNITDNLQLTFS